MSPYLSVSKKNSFNGYVLNTVLCLSAAAAMIYEVGATQMLFFYFIQSSYSFATVLSVFLSGLGIGSYLIHRLQARINNALFLIMWAQLIVGLYVVFVYQSLFSVISHMSQLGTVFVSFIIFFIPTVLLGATFPLVSLSYKQEKNYAKNELTGLIYSIDLVGAIIGSLIAGFLIIPTWGIHVAFLLGAICNFIAAIIISLYKKKLKIAFFGIILILFSIFYFKFKQVNISLVFNTNLKRITQSERFHKNSPYGEVIIQGDKLIINKRGMCRLSQPDNYAKKMVEYTLKNKKKNETIRALVIGLGCGITTQELIKSFPQAIVDVVEINPEVVAANKLLTNIVANSRVITIIDDGLHFLRVYNGTKYDAILIDIERPDVVHSSKLYTVESFEYVKNTLASDGVFSIFNYDEIGRVDKMSRNRYLDILFYTIGEVFTNVYQYPGVFVGTFSHRSDEVYIPISEYAINTVSRNLLTRAFLQLYKVNK